MSSNDALEVATNEVDRLYEEFDSLSVLPRQNLHIGVARWKRRNGYCKYDTMLTKNRFNKRLTGTKTKHGHHSIVINEKILENGNRDGFIDTVRHELAHAIVFAFHDESQGHNHHWKAMASKLGADASSCHNKRDRSDEYDYYIFCPNCGSEGGRSKRSKVIKQPFNRKCGQCGHHPMSSYEAGQEPPTEGGVVAVESLAWNNKDEWLDAGRP